MENLRRVAAPRQASYVEQKGARPAASWVLGRSARWHTAEGAAILAEDAVEEDLCRDLAVIRMTGASTLIGIGLSGALTALVRLVGVARRTFQRARG